MMKVLSLALGSCLLGFCLCAGVSQSTNERNSTEQSAASTLSSSNVTSHAGPRDEDVQRITTPVIITSPHLDKHLPSNSNFTGSPLLGPIPSPREHYRPRQYLPVAQRPRQHHQYLEASSKELEYQSKEEHYSQPLPPDFFYTQQYLRTQQQKEMDEYQSKPPALSQAKHSAYGKPVKFDESDYTYPLTELKDLPASSEISGNGSPHPYPFVSSSEEGMEPPYRGDSTNKGALSSKQYHSSSLTSGYPTGTIKHQQETAGMWKKMMNLLAAFIPLGLFLAAIPPNVVTINTTQPDVPSRHRSVDPVTFPLFELLDKYGLDSLDDEACENRIFCEMSRLGRLAEANFIQRAFWRLAHDTPEKAAEEMGMRELFKAVRTNACDFYNCEEQKTDEERRQEKNDTLTEVPK